MVKIVENLSEAQLAFQVAGGAVDRFQVLRYRGSEGLCRLYRFEIEAASRESSVTFDEVVGRAAVLSVNTPGGRRWFHGIVSSFELTGETADQTYYRIELSPSAWLLTHRYGSRTYQNQSVPDIVADVLTRAGIPSDRFQFALTREYAPREYCVQYRETDYNFIARLLEEEGIWWCFEQAREGHTLVMADSSAAYQAIRGEATLPYAPPSGMNVPDEHVFRFRLGQSVRPGRVVLKDFNFENPALELKSTADSGRDAGLEISDYPGEYAQQAQGTALAQLRAEEFESGRVLGIGQSSCGRLSPGRTFGLIEHPSDALNASYLVTSIIHQGKQAVTRTVGGHNGHAGPLNGRIRHSLLAARGEDNGALRELADEVLRLASAIGDGDPTAHRLAASWLYHGGQVARDPANVAAAGGGDPLEMLSRPNLIDDPAASGRPGMDSPTYECRFECIPAVVSYRPPRITPWPVMRGTQTARVVGPPGEEIYTDEYGRVKVQFNWDREGRFDERSSCWIRVSQGMAGGGYGMMFLPRVGQEVVVDFLEGNPDQPLIVGRVYNADHMPPYALPAEKTKSVIKTHSTTGGGGTNELCFDDQKDAEQILLHAQKDLHVRVKNDRVENVQRDHHLTVDGSKHELVKLHKTAEVKLDHSEKIGGKKSLAVTGDIGIETKANFSTKANGSYFVHANSELVLESAKAITLKVGGNFIKIDAAGIVELGTMIKLNSGGSAGQGTPVVLKEATAPLVAATAKPGRDRRYSLEDAPTDGLTDASSLGAAAPPVEDSPKETSWIEIELVDEVGQPVPGEAYEIINPDGKTIARGTLDELGQAHVALREPGVCRITFPRLDAFAWERM